MPSLCSLPMPPLIARPAFRGRTIKPSGIVHAAVMLRTRSCSSSSLYRPLIHRATSTSHSHAATGAQRSSFATGRACPWSNSSSCRTSLSASSSSPLFSSTRPFSRTTTTSKLLQPDLETIADALSAQLPKEDPRSLRPSAIQRFVQHVSPGSKGLTETELKTIQKLWAKAFDARMFEEVEDLMADAGEMSDGELPSRTTQNLKESGFAENTDAYTDEDVDAAASGVVDSTNTTVRNEKKTT
ncbi:unnamed protein product [Amoebophrya sp. A120]|nr:unnamed protein product [Amoebophrya sp. A120]|eukprot:GSA120T00023683001.1